MKKLLLTGLYKLIFYTLFFLPLSTSAQTTPELRCLSVQPNGNVQVTWVPVTQTLGFTRYEIHRLFSTIVTPVTGITTNTFLDTQVNGNVQANDYQVAAVYNLFTHYYSNQMFTMHLITTSTTNTNPGTANLSWNGLPLQSSGTSDYITYSSYNTGSMQPFGMPNGNNTQTQNINDCNVPVQYQVKASDALGCISQSNLVTDTFSQLGNVVDNPALRCASVLSDGSVQLTWLSPASSNADFNEFEIWSDGVLMDSISSFNQTSYTDLNVNANTGPHSYQLISQSGCAGNLSSPSPAITLSTIYLVVASPAINTCQLSWTPLPLLPSSPFYQVNRDISGSSTLIGNTTNLTYLDTNIPGPVTAYYQISVPDNSGCISNSNISAGCNVASTDILTPAGCNVEHTFNGYTNTIDFESLCINDQKINFELYNSMGQLTSAFALNKNANGNYSLQKSKLNKGLNLFIINANEHSFSGKIVVP